MLSPDIQVYSDESAPIVIPVVAATASYGMGLGIGSALFGTVNGAFATAGITSAIGLIAAVELEYHRAINLPHYHND